jgi:hypothetical protein
MTYPDGRLASGYLDDDRSDPRKSRVHDAGSSKDVLGNLSVHFDKSTGVPADRQTGLLTINGALTGYLSIGKDTTCPMWTDQQRSSILYSVSQGQIDDQGFHPFFTKEGKLRSGLEFLTEKPNIPVPREKV